MIAARLAGGNLFLAFWGWGLWEHSEQLGALGALGFFWVGDFGSTRSTRMIFQGGGVCFGL